MLFTSTVKLTLKAALAQAFIHQRQQHYAAAKLLIQPFTIQYPQNTELKELYQKVEQQCSKQRKNTVRLRPYVS